MNNHNDYNDYERFKKWGKELDESLSKYPSTLEEWKQICTDFNNKSPESFGNKIRQRMTDLANLNNVISCNTHMRGWYDEYDAYEDMYNSFFAELNEIYQDLEAKYNICTDPIWLWDNDDRSTHFRLSVVNDSIIPNKDVRIVIYFDTGFSPLRVDLTVDDKSVLEQKAKRKKKI